MVEDSISLYARLGGETVLGSAVNRLFDRVLADPELQRLFVGIDIDRLKTCSREFLVQALGGLRTYSGADLRTVHFPLSIQSAHFERVCDHLVDCLFDLGIDEDAIGDVVSVLEPLGAEIVRENPRKVR